MEITCEGHFPVWGGNMIGLKPNLVRRTFIKA
jgi:hypothetical protein